MKLLRLFAIALVIANATLAGLIATAGTSAFSVALQGEPEADTVVATDPNGWGRIERVEDKTANAGSPTARPDDTAPIKTARGNPAQRVARDVRTEDGRRKETVGAAAGPRTAQEDGCQTRYGSSAVARATLTTRVEDREPVDHVCTVEESSILFFSDLRHMKNREIRHRWSHDGKVRSVKPFQIRGNRWRVWSAIDLVPAWAGDWAVEVIDEQGQTLATTRFLYRPTENSSTAASR